MTTTEDDRAFFDQGNQGFKKEPQTPSKENVSAAEAELGKLGADAIRLLVEALSPEGREELLAAPVAVDEAKLADLQSAMEEELNLGGNAEGLMVTVREWLGGGAL